LIRRSKKTLVVVRGGGGVRAHNLLRLAFDVGGEGNVLADGKAENVTLLGELEAVDCCVVGEDRLLPQLELLKSIRLEYLASTALAAKEDRAGQDSG